MEIQLREITVGEVFDGYLNDEATGQVTAYGGRLNVRPAYQREFVYDDAKKKAVMHSVLHGFPLNVMYWSDNGDGTYEMLDGQQRTLSLCDWLDGGYSVLANPASPDTPYYAHTSPEMTARVRNYRLMVYVCKGSDTEKLDWFKIINIAGEKLTEQELRNAVYTGPWLADAKQYFSKRQCAAYRVGEKYLTGTPIRQDYLETVLRWAAAAEGVTIEQYMAAHQHDTHATPLKQYFRAVIDWVELTFPQYRKLMKGVEWGLLYNEFGGGVYDPAALEVAVSALLADDDVTRQKGIFEYLLSGRVRERALSIRAFTDNQKRTLYERQGGVCPMCAAEGCVRVWAPDEMHADHIVPWSRGGHTLLENGQLLCREHNLRKSDK